MMTFTPHAHHVLWFEEEDREASIADIERAYITCDGTGYQVMRRFDAPTDPDAFPFATVTGITKDNAVEITARSPYRGQRQILSPHSFHERYEID